MNSSLNSKRKTRFLMSTKKDAKKSIEKNRKKTGKNAEKNINKPDLKTPEVDPDSFFSVMDEGTSPLIKEAYRNARTNIMFAVNKAQGCRRILIASSVPGEGKSTTCINVATVFAQTDAKVLLIDADLRKPRIHKYLKLTNKIGFSSVLGRFCEIEDLEIIKCEYGFDVITAGPIPPNPAELLSSETMSKMLEYLEDKYDYIFLDSPPVNLISDPMIISKHADGVIIVTRQKYTSHDAIKKAITSLEFANAKIIGIILNDVQDVESGYDYKYKYSYGRGYYDHKHSGAYGYHTSK